MSVRTNKTAKPDRDDKQKPLQPRFPRDHIEYDHEYEARIRDTDCVQQITEKLRHCMSGMLIERAFEKALYDHGIIGTDTDKKSLLVLERSLLDMAATPDLCQGVFYCIVMQVQEQTVVSYFEGGQYRGFMKRRGQELLAEQLSITSSELLPWLTYTDCDLADRQMEISGRKKPPEEHKGKQKLSVPFLVVHTLKAGANDKIEDDRYIHVRTTSTEQTETEPWVSAFREHIIDGAHTNLRGGLFCMPTCK